MEIGILTFHNALNQGAVLQAYALQTYIEKRGHKVEFIDFSPRYKYTIKGDIIGKTPRNTFFKWQNVYNRIKYRTSDFSKVLHVSPYRYKSFKELKENPPIYDLYICGSDQVWHFPKDLNPVYLMDFLPDGSKIISYAASMGQHFPPSDKIEKLKSSLFRFDGLSLREDVAVDYVNHLFSGEREIFHNIDPTLLILSSEYDKIMEQVETPERYIATYILNRMDPQHYDILSEAQRVLNTDIINLRNPTTCIILKGKENKIVTPYQWLSYIKNSAVVIAGSFHAVVFALIFHKPFVLIQPQSLVKEGGNKRVMSLLNPLGLSHHCIYDSSDVESLLKENIDWDVVDNKILDLAEESKQYLNKYV